MHPSPGEPNPSANVETKNAASSHQDLSRRLIRRALATGYRAARFSQHIDEHCTHCGIIETDAHLFFHCDFARAVWFSATPPLRTDNLPLEDDGV